MLYTTCQKILQACAHPFFEAEEKVYVSRSGPPFGRTMMAYTCDPENVSWEDMSKMKIQPNILYPPGLIFSDPFTSLYSSHNDKSREGYLPLTT